MMIQWHYQYPGKGDMWFRAEEIESVTVGPNCLMRSEFGSFQNRNDCHIAIAMRRETHYVEKGDLDMCNKKAAAFIERLNSILRGPCEEAP